MAHSIPTMDVKRLWAQTAISNAKKSNSIRRWELPTSGSQESRGGQDPTGQGGQSASKGHKKRLEQRQRALAGMEQELKDAKHQHDKLAEQAAAFGSPGERADRDFLSKQS